MRRICVYCGSSPGLQPEYIEAAKKLGSFLAYRKIGLVYGGSNVGLMGAVADAAMENEGETIGVITKALAQHVAHDGLKNLQIVDSMHDRKQRMFDLSDGFIALPGGIGTLEELLEVLTWSQLGYHDKPCALLNVCDYYSGLMTFLDHAADQRFLKDVHRNLLIVDQEPESLIEKMAQYQPVKSDKWID